METSQYDILVVGAGCAGSLAAYEAAGKGFSVGLLEEHPQIGIPSHCSGVVSLKGLQLIGVEPRQEFVQRKVVGARIYSPSGIEIEIRRKDPVAYVLNRAQFDQSLARRAEERGVKIHLSTRAVELVKEGSSAAGVRCPGQEISSSLIIDASGVGSRLPTSVGLERISNEGILPGMQYELTDCETDHDYVEVYFGRKYAPGFFAWTIPTGKNTKRVGLATRHGRVKDLLNRFVKDKFPQSNIDSAKSGSVLVSGPLKRTCANSIIVVGDARKAE